MTETYKPKNRDELFNLGRAVGLSKEETARVVMLFERAGLRIIPVELTDTMRQASGSDGQDLQPKGGFEDGYLRATAASPFAP